jgi:DNA adenine methylase
MKERKLNSPLAWVGGKRQLRKEIVPMIPDDHETYVEVFAGGAWVLFGKEPSKVEVINDINGELVNFWKVVKQRPQAFVAELRYLVASREIFSIIRSVDTCYLSEVVRACRFFYLNKNSFSSKGEVFSARPGQARMDPDKVNDVIEQACHRIARITIERLDFRVLFKRYNKPATFFYVDPPYVDCPGCYEHLFKEQDHRDLAAILAGIKGRFILSYNDHPLVRRLYKKFKTRKVSATYTLSQKKPDRIQELLIWNFKLGREALP